MLYHECPICGASLDPGETCDICRSREEKEKAPEQIAQAAERDDKHADD